MSNLQISSISALSLEVVAVCRNWNCEAPKEKVFPFLTQKRTLSFLTISISVQMKIDSTHLFYVDFSLDLVNFQLDYPHSWRMIWPHLLQNMSKQFCARSSNIQSWLYSSRSGCYLHKCLKEARKHWIDNCWYIWLLTVLFHCLF